MVSSCQCDYSWRLCPKPEHTQGQPLSTLQWRTANVRERLTLGQEGGEGVEETEAEGQQPPED